MAIFNGTAGADTITGTEGVDVINGLAGDDNLLGLGGVDTINGGAGNDTLDGGAGADLLYGDVGDDTYLVDDAGDLTVENPGDSTVPTFTAGTGVVGAGGDRVVTTVNYALTGGSSIEVLQAAGTAGLSLVGNELAQIVIGNTGANFLDGGNDQVADTLLGGTGNDTYLARAGAAGAQVDVVFEAANGGSDTVFSTGSYTLAANSSVEALSANDQTVLDNFNFFGNEVAQTIVGTYGNNTFVDNIFANTAVAGDTMIGLRGDDTYFVSGTGVVVQEAVGEGNDYIYSTANFTLSAGSSVEILVANSATGILLQGNTLNQGIFGNNGNDTLNGGGGFDQLQGSLGDDTYIVDSLDDTVFEVVGTGNNQGNDQVVASSSYALFESANAAGASNIEVLLAAGFNNVFNATTNPGFVASNLNTYNLISTTNYFVGDTFQSQTIWGDAGQNILNGRQGTGAGGVVDTLVGLNGDDIYRVYAQGDVVIEDANGGSDIIYTSATYNLATNDQNAANTIAVAATGTSQIEVLSTSSQAGTAAINLTGNNFANILIGNYGANVISGGGIGAGGVADSLVGLLGDDTYNVEAASTFINEAVGEGTDTANIFVNSFTLNAGSSVEFVNLVAAVGAGNAGSVFVGNELAQTITGSAGNDVISSGGGAGDAMLGGAGDDIYRVFSAADTVVEVAGNGNDTVFATGSYNLAANTAATPVSVERLSTATQASTDAVTLTGNQLSQLIQGNNGDNTLDAGSTDGGVTGGFAADTLEGLLGNDTYRVYTTTDVVREQVGGGTDTVTTSASYQLAAGAEVEILQATNTTTTATLDRILYGNEFSQALIGNDGNNTIDGGLGNDTLTGLGRADTFQFSTALSSNNVDTITDFTTAGDVIQLTTAIFGSVGAAVDAGELVVGTAALDANDFLVYNQTTGELFYDQDGNGALNAVLFARLSPGTVLAATDFNVVAAIPAIVAA